MLRRFSSFETSDRWRSNEICPVRSVAPAHPKLCLRGGMTYWLIVVSSLTLYTIRDLATGSGQYAFFFIILPPPILSTLLLLILIIMMMMMPTLHTCTNSGWCGILEAHIT